MNPRFGGGGPVTCESLSAFDLGGTARDKAGRTDKSAGVIIHEPTCVRLFVPVVAAEAELDEAFAIIDRCL